MKNIDLSYLTSPVSDINTENRTYFHPYAKGKELRTSLNGEWRFRLYDVLPEEVLNEDYDFSAWNQVKVPSHFETTGYGKPQYLNTMYPWEAFENVPYWGVPAVNPCGVYQKEVVIDDEEEIHDLEVNGFESALYVYINGQFAGYSSNGFCTNVFKTSSYFHKGKNSLVLIVYKYSAASWVTDQDMWRLHGLFRSVDLVSLPSLHFKNIVNDSVLAADLTKGNLKISYLFEGIKKGSRLRYVLLDEEKKTIIDKEIPLSSYGLEINEEIKDVHPWSDEIPHLYTLKSELKDGDEVKESADLKIGFRRIEIRNGIILLNGRRLIIKGTNRHEFDCHTGRVMTREETEADIKLLKANNFNAVRTSHYPDINDFYELCDEYGILVCDEAPIETHGTWSNVEAKKGQKKEDLVLPGNDRRFTDFIVKRGTDMIDRDRNHASVIFWSLGNESYVGSSLLMEARAFRKKDPTRLVHYEGNSWVYPDYLELSDVISRMYPHPDDIAGFLKKHHDKPYILCEFEHSMGNSTGNFDEYMKLIAEYPQFQGGFIWDFVDQGFLIDGKMYYGGDFGDYPNDYNFCADGLLLADRTPTGKLTEVKYCYQPLKFTLTYQDVTIHNNFLFKDTSDYDFIYETYADGKKTGSEEFTLNVKAGEEGKYVLKNPVNLKDGSFIYARLSVRLKENTSYAYRYTEMMKEETFLKGNLTDNEKSFTEPQDGGLEVFESSHHITVKKGDFLTIFNGKGVGRAGLECIIKDGHRYFEKEPYPTLYRPTTDNDMTIGKYLQSFYIGASMYPGYSPSKRFVIRIREKSPSKVVIEVRYLLIIGILIRPLTVTYTVYGNETIKVETTFKRVPVLPAPPLFGLRFQFDKAYSEFSYLGLGPEENYLDRYHGQDYGYYSSDAKKEYVPYSMPQECGNHLFTREVTVKEGDKSITFTSLEKNFSFKYLPYDEMTLDHALRQDELPEPKYNFLTICGFNKGVGGDDSWGSPVHKAYTMQDKKAKLSFLISVK